MEAVHTGSPPGNHDTAARIAFTIFFVILYLAIVCEASSDEDVGCIAFFYAVVTCVVLLMIWSG